MTQSNWPHIWLRHFGSAKCSNEKLLVLNIVSARRWWRVTYLSAMFHLIFRNVVKLYQRQAYDRGGVENLPTLVTFLVTSNVYAGDYSVDRSWL